MDSVQIGQPRAGFLTARMLRKPHILKTENDLGPNYRGLDYFKSAWSRNMARLVGTCLLVELCLAGLAGGSPPEMRHALAQDWRRGFASGPWRVLPTEGGLLTPAPAALAAHPNQPLATLPPHTRQLAHSFGHLWALSQNSAGNWTVYGLPWEETMNGNAEDWKLYEGGSYTGQARLLATDTGVFVGAGPSLYRLDPELDPSGRLAVVPFSPPLKNIKDWTAGDEGLTAVCAPGFDGHSGTVWNGRLRANGAMEPMNLGGVLPEGFAPVAAVNAPEGVYVAGKRAPGGQSALALVKPFDGHQGAVADCGPLPTGDLTPGCLELLGSRLVFHGHAESKTASWALSETGWRKLMDWPGADTAGIISSLSQGGGAWCSQPDGRGGLFSCAWPALKDHEKNVTQKYRRRFQLPENVKVDRLVVGLARGSSALPQVRYRVAGEDGRWSNWSTPCCQKNIDVGTPARWLQYELSAPAHEPADWQVRFVQLTGPDLGGHPLPSADASHFSNRISPRRFHRNAKQGSGVPPSRPQEEGAGGEGTSSAPDGPQNDGAGNDNHSGQGTGTPNHPSQDMNNQAGTASSQGQVAAANSGGSQSPGNHKGHAPHRSGTSQAADGSGTGADAPKEEEPQGNGGNTGLAHQGAQESPAPDGGEAPGGQLMTMTMQATGPESAAEKRPDRALSNRNSNSQTNSHTPFQNPTFSPPDRRSEVNLAPTDLNCDKLRPAQGLIASRSSANNNGTLSGAQGETALQSPSPQKTNWYIVRRAMLVLLPQWLAGLMLIGRRRQKKDQAQAQRLAQLGQPAYGPCRKPLQRVVVSALGLPAPAQEEDRRIATAGENLRAMQSAFETPAFQPGGEQSHQVRPIAFLKFGNLNQSPVEPWETWRGLPQAGTGLVLHSYQETLYMAGPGLPLFVSRLNRQGAPGAWLRLGRPLEAARVGSSMAAWDRWLVLAEGAFAGQPGGLWTLDLEMPLRGWKCITQLPAATRHHAVTVSPQGIVVTGGADAQGPCRNAAWLPWPDQNQPGAWRSLPSLPMPLRRHGMVSDGHGIFVIGGELAQSTWRGLKDCWRLAGFSGQSTWQPLPDLPQPKVSPALVSGGGRVFVIGGESVTDLRSVSSLDLDSNGWRSIAPLPEPLTAPSGVVHGRHLVVGGGRYYRGCFRSRASMFALALA